jgi:DNA-binding transcriptional LysR family regulator
MFENLRKIGTNQLGVPKVEQNPVLSLIDIQTLVKVAELHSLTKAANALGMAKSSISRNLDRLEADLGVTLVQRTGKQVSLTSTGSAFYAYAQRILGDVEEASSAVSQLRSSPKGHVRIAAPVGSGQLLLAPLILEFLGHYPEITVSLELTSRNVDPIEEQVDVVIHVGTPANIRLVARKLGEFPIRLYASPSYLQGKGTPLTIEALSQHVSLDLFEGPHEWRLFGPEREAVVTITPRFAANDLSTLTMAAESGLGLAWLPPFMCVQQVAAGRLIQVLPEWDRGTREVYALYPTPRTLSSRVRALIDFLIERFPRGNEPSLHSKLS